MVLCIFPVFYKNGRTVCFIKQNVNVAMYCVCDNMMLTFRFVSFHFVSFRSVYYTVLYSVLFRSLPFSFGEENDSNVRKTNTCVKTVLERNDSRTYGAII